jgi:predicted nucleotidyltransferase
MEKHLNQLLDRLKKTYGDRLVSLILFGSAASGDYQGAWSDLNVLCVLERLGVRELGEAEPLVRWWRELGNPSPLLLARDEIAASTDCFPIEFHDLRQSRKVLHGLDVVEGLEIDPVAYRVQIEHELRAKLIRLRQKAAGVASDRDLLLRLMGDSIGTFCVLVRHALRVCGVEPAAQRREALAQAGPALGIEPRGFYTLLDLRDGLVKPRGVDAVSLFAQYLGEIEQVVRSVDRTLHGGAEERSRK